MTEVNSKDENAASDVADVTDVRNKDSQNEGETKSGLMKYTDVFYVLIVILISIITYPKDFIYGLGLHVGVPLSFVWYYGWITCAATGLGAVPFMFWKEPSKLMIGLSNGKI